MSRNRGAPAAVLAATQAFLATLDDAQRTEVSGERTAANLAQWSNLPDELFERAGLRMDSLNETQQAAVLKILQAALSAEGYTQVTGITTADGVLATQGGMDLDFGADHYWIRILGTPAATGAWNLQYGGHHLAVNVTLEGEDMTLAPTLWGAQPASYEAAGTTTEPLSGETTKAFAVIGALDAEESAAKLAAAEQNIDQTTFAWYGATQIGNPIYYRVQGPTFTIEFAHQQGQGANAGLTGAEAEARRRRGEANTGAEGGTRTYASILRTNVFSFFNTVLFVIGVALLALGRYSDALISVGLGLINALISAVQEIRAKRKLDRLQLLDRAAVVAVRDGREIEIAPEDVVRGDVLRVRAGGQIVVDGPVLQGSRLEADESLLIGESDPVAKSAGDDLRSGSLCVAGDGHQLARDVGRASYAGRLTAQARRSTTDATPLQRRIGFVVRLVIALTVLMSGAILAQAALEGFTLLRVVQITAVLSGLVPYGLFLLIAVAYTAGASRIAGCGALVQQVNAVESVSNVDVVCTDKTGTLTTGRLTLKEVEPVGGADVAPLGSFARSVTTPNLTTAALASALPGEPWTVRDEVPFASSLRWSGLVVGDPDDEGVWVLGAPDALAPHLRAPLPPDAVGERTALGLRVLVLARAVDPDGRLRDAEGRPALPRLVPVAVVALADELRPEVAETVTRLRQNGVAPEHKERIVGSLRRTGHYVAMIGDGVNDARALKAAQVGVAMCSGSAVTRDVADIVLVDDSFAALLPAQREGRRIIDGIATSMYVFLARVAGQGLVILAVTMLGLGFPYSPTQVGLTLLTVGIPTLFLTVWARPVPPDEHLLGNLARFVVPAAVVTAAFGTAVYAFLYTSVAEFLGSGRRPARIISDFESYTGLTYTDADFQEAAATIGAQTGLSTFSCLASFLLILFLAPPTRFFAAWTRPTGDRRPALLVVALVAVFFAVLFVPALYTYFGLTAGNSFVLAVVLAALVPWFAALTVAYRYRLLDRLLGLEELPGRSRP